MLADLERHVLQPTESLHRFKQVIAQILAALLQKSPNSTDDKQAETVRQSTSYSVLLDIHVALH